MKASTKKWVHAGLVACFATWTDVGAQLATGGVNLTRAVMVGLVMGGLGRIAGAVLAAIITSNGAESVEDDADPESDA